MARSVGIVFSNIHDKEVNELTEKRTLASVPFGGRYRLIDFVLSNMVNSGITNVGVITKYNYQSLMNHVGSGKAGICRVKTADLRFCRLSATTIRPRYILLDSKR